jgi:secreted trypsin-like serine protease
MLNNGGTWELFAVTSWGIGCAEKGRPGVYAKIKRKTFSALISILFLSYVAQ